MTGLAIALGVLVLLGVSLLLRARWVAAQPERESQRQIARMRELKRQHFREFVARAKRPPPQTPPRTRRPNALWDRT